LFAQVRLGRSARTAGFSFSTFGYNTNASAGANVAAAREIEIGALNPTLRGNLSAHLNAVGAYQSTRLANLGIGHGAADAGAGYTYFDPSTGNF
jgi:hypothetical protein